MGYSIDMHTSQPGIKGKGPNTTQQGKINPHIIEMVARRLRLIATGGGGVYVPMGEYSVRAN